MTSRYVLQFWQVKNQQSWTDDWQMWSQHILNKQLLASFVSFVSFFPQFDTNIDINNNHIQPKKNHSQFTTRLLWSRSRLVPVPELGVRQQGAGEIATLLPLFVGRENLHVSNGCIKPISENLEVCDQTRKNDPIYRNWLAFCWLIILFGQFCPPCFAGGSRMDMVQNMAKAALAVHDFFSGNNVLFVRIPAQKKHKCHGQFDVL